MHDKGHHYDLSLGIVILILCINLSLLHYLSTSEFIQTTHKQGSGTQARDFPSVPENVWLVS